MKALDDAVEVVEKLAFTIDFNDRSELLKVVDSCIATKFTRRFGTLIPVWTHPLPTVILQMLRCSKSTDVPGRAASGTQ